MSVKLVSFTEPTSLMEVNSDDIKSIFVNQFPYISEGIGWIKNYENGLF